MAQLFNISGWSNSTTYVEDDICSLDVTGKTYYFYSLLDSNLNKNPTGTNGWWSRFWHWKPSYNTSISTTFLNDKIQFGEGYAQILSQTLNPKTLNLDLGFNNITKKRAKAMMHYLSQTNGVSPIVLTFGSIYDFSNLSFLISAPPQLSHQTYDSYNLSLNAIEINETAEYLDSINLNVNAATPVYFWTGLNIEGGIYKIKYRDGVASMNTGSSVWAASGSLDVTYNTNQIYRWTVSGDGPGIFNSWNNYISGTVAMQRVNPQLNFLHTGGKIGITFIDANYADNLAYPYLRYSLYKIGHI